jgi:hypothetical protein
MGGQSHASAALPPVKSRYPLYARLDGSKNRSERVRKIWPPPEFDPRTNNPVAIRYTDRAIPAHPLPQHWMKESVHLHAPVALPPDEKPRYPFEGKLG